MPFGDWIEVLGRLGDGSGGGERDGWYFAGDSFSRNSLSDGSSSLRGSLLGDLVELKGHTILLN